MKEIKLIPVINAAHFSNKVEDEFAEHEISTHYQSDIVNLDWDEDYYPEFQKWLVETYGESIKDYSQFAIQAT